MINKFFVKSIELYQKHISPHKGYRCAYRASTGGHSCSEFTKLAISEHGLITAYPQIREQFRQCKLAAEKIEEDKKKKNKKDDKSSSWDCADPSCTECGCDVTRGCMSFRGGRGHDHSGDCHSCDSFGIDF